MDDKIISLTKELKEALFSREEFKEYFRLKEEIEKSPYLSKLRKQIALNIDNKEVHDSLLEKYNNDPLVVNFYAIREEVMEVLRVVKVSLS